MRSERCATSTTSEVVIRKLEFRRTRTRRRTHPNSSGRRSQEGAFFPLFCFSPTPFEEEPGRAERHTPEGSKHGGGRHDTNSASTTTSDGDEPARSFTPVDRDGAHSEKTRSRDGVERPVTSRGGEKNRLRERERAVRGRRASCWRDCSSG